MFHAWVFDGHLVVGALPVAADTVGVFSVGGWLMAAVVVAIGGIYVARRVRGWAEKSEQVDNFSLQKLRDMLQAGRISKAEFDVLKQQVIRTAAAEPRPDDSNTAAGREGIGPDLPSDEDEEE